MWLIVGLGNPGRKYSGTRHNIGFLVLDRFAEKHHLEFQERKEYRICSGSVEDVGIVLLEPLTFMNRSGTAVRKVMDKYSIPPENLIAVHDDLDLDTGKLKIRKKGSSGGHRGIESIIQHTGSRDFIRLKIGIGRSEVQPPEEFVLSKFTKDEQATIREAAARAVDAILVIIREGAEKAMNRFH